MTRMIVILVFSAVIAQGCAARPRPISLSEYLGDHSGVARDAVRIVPLGVRSPTARDLVVDLALEGPRMDVWRAANTLWGTHITEEQDWIRLTGPRSRRFAMKTYKPPTSPFGAIPRWNPIGPRIEHTSIGMNDDEEAAHVRTMLSLSFAVPLFYAPPDGVHTIELVADRLATIGRLPQIPHQASDGAHDAILRRATIVSDVPAMSFFAAKRPSTVDE
jgi:hypothetical protein